MQFFSHAMGLCCFDQSQIYAPGPAAFFVLPIAMAYFAFGVEKGNFPACQTLGHNSHKSRARNIHLHTPSILQSASWSPFSSFCEISCYSCHKARLIVVVEAKLCCVSSPRGGFRRTPKLSQRQPLKPTYFSTTRLSNQKRL